MTYLLQKVTPYAVVPAVLTPMCFLFIYGYSIGTTNSAARPLRHFYNESHQIRYGVALTSTELDALWRVTAASFPLGGIVGALFVRSLVAKIGRRRSLIYSQIICLLSTLLICSSYFLHSYETLIVGRFLLSWFVVVGLGVGPMYVSEISASHVRGIFGSLFSAAISFGAVSGNVLGLPEVLGSSDTWPYLLAITAVPSIIYLGYSPWLPESPRALYLEKNDPESAKKVLERLRGGSDVSEELELLQEEKEILAKIKLMTIYELLTTKSVRWQLASCLVIMISQQFSGISGVLFYLNKVFMNAGIPQDISGYMSIGATLILLFVTFISAFATERLGRKKLLLIGYGIVCFAILVYTIMTALQHLVPWFSYVCVVASIVFLIGFGIGPGPVTLAMVPELFDQSARPAAMTLGAFTLWLCFTVVGLSTPYLFDHLQFAALLPYFFLAFGAGTYIYFVIPETKGKSVVEIQTFFAKWNKVAIASVQMTSQQKKDFPLLSSNNADDEGTYLQNCDSNQTSA